MRIKYRVLDVTSIYSPVNKIFTCRDKNIPLAFIGYKFENHSDYYYRARASFFTSVNSHRVCKQRIYDIEITRVTNGGTVRVVVPYVGQGEYFGNINLPFSMIMSEII